MKNRAHRGFVLVFALLLLLTMTFIGISVMSGSQMQERMAGNAKLQSLAFQAATAGVADAIPFVQWIAPSGLVCGESDYDAYAAVWLADDGRPRPTPWYSQETFGQAIPGDQEARSRLYCLWEDMEDQGRSNLYVESEGFVMIDGDRVAQRSVEVRVVSGRDSALGNPTCAVQTICDPSKPNPLSAFNPPSSKASFIGGDSGHAFCTCSDGMRDTITAEIKANRQESFTGVEGEGADAIQNIDSVPPFDSVTNFNGLIAALRAVADPDTLTVGDHSGSFDWPNQVRFIEGDLYARGGNTGSGILVVTGNIELRGNFRYDGLIIGMGEILSLRGAGGKNDGVRGSVVAAPINGTAVGAVNLSFHEEEGRGGAGGGGVSYAFDCDALVAAEALLEGTLAASLWQANCDGGIENIFESGPAELQLVSSRENLGWREKIGFFSENEMFVNFP